VGLHDDTGREILGGMQSPVSNVFLLWPRFRSVVYSDPAERRWLLEIIATVKCKELGLEADDFCEQIEDAGVGRLESQGLLAHVECSFSLATRRCGRFTSVLAILAVGEIDCCVPEPSRTVLTMETE
jgi:hypothetical protein